MNTQESRPRGQAKFYWLLVIIVSLALTVVLGSFGQSPHATLLSLLLLGICLYPTVRFFLEDSTAFPIIPIMAGAIAIQYSIPVFLGDRMLTLIYGPTEISGDALIVALYFAIGGTVLFLVTSLSKFVRIAINVLPTIELNLNRSRALWYCLTVGVGSFFGSSLFSIFSSEALGQYGAVIRVFNNQTLVSIAILSWLAETGGSLKIRMVLYALVGFATAAGVSGGSLENALSPLGVMFACHWIFSRRINKTLIVLLLALALFFNPAKSDYRQEAWFGSMANESMTEKMSFWTQLSASYWGDVLAGNRNASDATAQFISRTNLIDTLAHVVDLTPETVPYFGGETYNYFMYTFTPRILWPEKPTASANAALAVAYGLQTEEGAQTSTFGIGLFGEGYANFGWMGIALVAIVLALALLAMQRLFGTERSGAGGAAILIAFFVFFVNGLGSSAEIMLGNIFQSLFVNYVLLYVVIEKRGLPVRGNVDPRMANR